MAGIASNAHLLCRDVILEGRAGSLSSVIFRL